MSPVGDLTDSELKTCKNVLDKLTIKSLRLIEEKLKHEVNIETRIQEGSFNLAKSRYIMGQQSVSALRLPLDSEVGFSATKAVEIEENHMKLVTRNGDDVINPIKWFGVLLPQNLHKAQSIFQNTLDYLIDCVNVQLDLDYTRKCIQKLKHVLRMSKEE